MHYVKLLLEPVAIVCLCWLLITLRLWRGKLPYRKLAITTLFGFWFIASPLGANSLVWLLERNYRQPERCATPSGDDFIIVLGGGKKGSVAAPDQIEVLMERTLIRTFAGIRLWRDLEQRPRLIFSGGGYGEVKEADLMSVLGVQMGVPPAQQGLERISMNTWENAEGVAALLSGKSHDRLYLVTSAMHMPRARAVFSRVGLEVCPYPVDQLAFLPDFGGLWIPSLRPLRKSSVALHEYKGLLWYFISGKL